jgi:hypothetical protein
MTGANKFPWSLWMAPVLPEAYGDLPITNSTVASGRITIDVADANASVRGLPNECIPSREQAWMTELMDQARLRPKTQPGPSSAVVQRRLGRDTGPKS